MPKKSTPKTRSARRAPEPEHDYGYNIRQANVRIEGRNGDSYYQRASTWATDHGAGRVMEDEQQSGVIVEITGARAFGLSVAGARALARALTNVVDGA